MVIPGHLSIPLKIVSSRWCEEKGKKGEKETAQCRKPPTNYCPKVFSATITAAPENIITYVSKYIPHGCTYSARMIPIGCSPGIVWLLPSAPCYAFFRRTTTLKRNEKFGMLCSTLTGSLFILEADHCPLSFSFFFPLGDVVIFKLSNRLVVCTCSC